MHFWRILIKGICVLAKARSRSSHFIISVYTQWTQHHLSRIICKRGRGRDILLVCGQICRDFRARYCAALGADFSRMASPSQQPWLGALSCTHTQPMVYVCIYGVLWGGGGTGAALLFFCTHWHSLNLWLWLPCVYALLLVSWANSECASRRVPIIASSMMCNHPSTTTTTPKPNPSRF